MNQPVKNQKPFGLTLACKIAAEALKQSVAPTSVVLGNLLYLQKDTLFPKELDTHFFSFQKKAVADNDKKIIAILLDELKKPQDNIANTLEKFITPNWVVKKLVPAPSQPKYVQNKAKDVQKKSINNNVKSKKKHVQVKVEPATPVVVVKKSKLTI